MKITLTNPGSPPTRGNRGNNPGHGIRCRSKVGTNCANEQEVFCARGQKIKPLKNKREEEKDRGETEKKKKKLWRTLKKARSGFPVKTWKINTWDPGK